VSCPTENQYKINLPSERKSVKIYVAGIAVQTTNWSAKCPNHNFTSKTIKPDVKSVSTEKEMKRFK
jgi:hypothetical protein